MKSRFIQPGLRLLVAICSIFFVTIMVQENISYAATIEFDPQETTVGMSSPFLIGVTIDSETPVNALRIVIDVPDYMEVLNVSDGNSIINMWVDRPHVTNSRQLVFEGIVPGGYSGIRGKLVTLTVQAKKEGSFDFSLSPSSRIYANDQYSSRQSIASRPLELAVVAGRDNISNIIPDRTAPETFVPSLVEIPSGDSSSWAVSFVAQDKQSGIAAYYVAESVRKYDAEEALKSSRLSWRYAQSPMTLADQGLTSYVYVKALDMSDNARIAIVNPIHKPRWYQSPGGYILILLIIFIVLYALSRRLHWKIG